VVALEVWFDEDQAAGLAVGTPAELDAVLDDIAEMSTDEWPVLAQMVFTEDGKPAKWSPTFDLGFRRDVGVLFFSDNPRRGYYSVGAGSADGEPLLYMYMSSDTEFPSNAEVSAAVVRQAAHEVLTTRERPTCVEWQPRHGAQVGSG
jgi:hypothetical protein